MGFEFSSHTVTVEIGGKPYVINMGDADMLDKVEHWSDKLAGTDYRGLSEGRLNALSADVRNYLMALLGKEQFEQDVRLHGPMLRRRASPGRAGTCRAWP